MATKSPLPFAGSRPLTPKEILQRAKAVNCTLAKNSKPTWGGQFEVGKFFDGTGNNMVEDFDNPKPDARKHNNVVKP